MKNFLSFLVAYLVVINLYAQGIQRTTVDNYNSWYMYFGTFKFSNNLSLHSEAQWRRSGLVADPQQLLLRLGVNFHISQSASLTAGYGFIDTHPYGDQPVRRRFTEHRIWEQLVLKHREGRFFFNHRFRQEQRWLELHNTEKEFNYLNRSRYRFMGSLPLNNESFNKGTWFLSVYDELFVNYGKNVARNIFDQNRLYGAVGYHISDKNSLQIGYLNQRIQKGDGTSFENNHTFQVGFFHNIDLTKGN